ncbi:DUF1793-domain-containing protein [Schizopora paradoxa]|uniref:DUF1793-domain-containing protein n=1 Tax=Schizopora paradoxa TaxID=27342 RepID=A0A0H2R8M1_9AGAM|nr:DUF1793-domain-containing protein [Schizopora paradoxa]
MSNGSAHSPSRVLGAHVIYEDTANALVSDLYNWAKTPHTPSSSMNLSILLLILASITLVVAQLRAPSWPLAVKNPYLNGWYAAGPDATPLNEVIVTTWNSSRTPWFCSVAVDGIPFRLMDNDTDVISQASSQMSVTITPTSTTIQGQAGPVAVTLTFLSPITPSDLTRQSLPYSYLDINVAPTDNSPHSVIIFSDFDLEWITGSDSLFGTGSGGVQPEFIFLKASTKTPQPFVEINDHAQDSTIIYAAKNAGPAGFEAGVDGPIRLAGMNGTGLPNIIDPDVGTHPIDDPHDVFGISVDVGEIDTSTSLLWAIGVSRDPSIQFTTPSGGVHMRSSYYQMNFSTPEDQVSFFLDDFANASSAANQLDTKIMKDASDISSAYSDLLSLLTRPATSALEITVSTNPNGTFNSSDVMAFMKDIGSVGGRGVNAVDVLYASFPMYLYLDPAIGGYLLKPLLVAQDTPQYTQPYAASNLDIHFPNATVQNVAHNFGIEQSGNMIIMLLAHLLVTKDGSLVSQYYGMIKGWADYLVQNSLHPGMQQTSQSDGITLVNQTNLALKGVIGIGAMAKISDYLKESDDASIYSSKAESYIQQWQSMAISQNQTRLLASFGNEDSTGLMYNLYADKLLGLGLVPQTVYDIQSAYLKSQLASSSFSIPLDSQNPTVGRADWLMFAAASTNDDALLDSLISMIHSYVFNPSNNVPVSPIFNPVTGQSGDLGMNRRVEIFRLCDLAELNHITVQQWVPSTQYWL